jgi:hypothetical protein
MTPVFGLGNLGRRLVESVVGVFAILGFMYVPLGRQTGFDHAKAVFSTPAAAAAIDDLTTTALSLRQRALAFITARATAPSAPIGPSETAARPHPREPRPVPPKLK